jgi:uncharacterized protein (TIGR03435 family)
MRSAVIFLSAGVFALCSLVSARAQAPPGGDPAHIAFEVASIKPNTTGAGGGANFQPGGRFIARNATLRVLIAIAFGDPVALYASRMTGGPSWVDNERFDVEARAAAEFPEIASGRGGAATGNAMLRALLVDRFHLATHWDMRTIPVYALVRQRGADVNPRIVSAAGTPGTDCLGVGAIAAAKNVLPRCGAYILLNTGGNQFAIHARGITMMNFARNLQNVAGRVVVDQTALPGTFNFDLAFEYRPTSAAADEGIGAAIFTAVQEQLGLRLQPTSTPVEVLVIDHIEHPTPD